METKKIMTKKESKEYRRHRHKTECAQDRVLLMASSEHLVVQSSIVETEISLNGIASYSDNGCIKKPYDIRVYALQTSKPPTTATEVKADFSQDNENQEQNVVQEYSKCVDTRINDNDVVISSLDESNDSLQPVQQHLNVSDENEPMNEATANQQYSNEKHHLINNYTVLGLSLPKGDGLVERCNLSGESEVDALTCGNSEGFSLDKIGCGDGFHVGYMLPAANETTLRSPIQHKLEYEAASHDKASKEVTKKHQLKDREFIGGTHSLVRLARIRGEGSVQKLVEFFENIKSWERQGIPIPHTSKSLQQRLLMIDKPENLILQEKSHKDRFNIFPDEYSDYQNPYRNSEGFEKYQEVLCHEPPPNQRRSLLTGSADASCAHDYDSFSGCTPIDSRFFSSGATGNPSYKYNYHPKLEQKSEDTGPLKNTTLAEVKNEDSNDIFYPNPKPNDGFQGNSLMPEKTPKKIPDSEEVLTSSGNLRNSSSENLRKVTSVFSEQGRNLCKSLALMTVHQQNLPFSIADVGKPVSHDGCPQLIHREYTSDKSSPKQHFNSDSFKNLPVDASQRYNVGKNFKAHHNRYRKNKKEIHFNVRNALDTAEVGRKKASCPKLHNLETHSEGTFPVSHCKRPNYSRSNHTLWRLGVLALIIWIYFSGSFVLKMINH